MARNRMNATRLAAAILVLGLALIATGCDDETTTAPTARDTQAPAVPTGVFTVTGDGMVTVYWDDIDEADLAGYAVYRYQGTDPVGGAYHWLADVAWNENYTDDSHLQHEFVDNAVVNGATYYYAVLSYDTSNNESNLSWETVDDTPRPEGIAIVLDDRALAPQTSGFDFSALEQGITAWNDPFADIYLAFDGSVPFVHVARDGEVAVQDYGTIPLQWVDVAPEGGYSALGQVELIAGHAYIVRILEPSTHALHYAKFWVYSIGSGTVEIDWAYQVDPDNPELRAPSGRGPVREGPAEVVRY